MYWKRQGMMVEPPFNEQLLAALLYYDKEIDVDYLKKTVWFLKIYILTSHNNFNSIVYSVRNYFIFLEWKNGVQKVFIYLFICIFFITIHF